MVAVVLGLQGPQARPRGALLAPSGISKVEGEGENSGVCPRVEFSSG